MAIKDILIHTKCPFAKGAKITVITINQLNLHPEIHACRGIISNFFRFDGKIDQDALVFIFKHPSFGNSLDHLALNTKKFFIALAQEFPDLLIPAEINDLNEVCWPAIEGERFFMVSFASCYPTHSPRFNHGDPYTYFFLQPVSSFERHAHDGEAITDEIRIKIRKLFERNNQPYDGELSNLKNEWVKMVSPLNLGDDIVKWWKR